MGFAFEPGRNAGSRAACGFDVLVAGAGPAGIAAAWAASRTGRRVGIVDDNPAPGGQIWRGDASAARPGRQAGIWLDRLRESGVEIMIQARIFDQPRAGLLRAEGSGGLLELPYGKLIVATGARERFLPFPGWTLPNVMGAGGLQAMVKAGLPVRGKRVIVAGTGPLLLAVAAHLRKRGAAVRLIAEQASPSRLARFGLAVSFDGRKLVEAASLTWKLRRVAYYTDCWPVAAEGCGKLEAVTLQRGAKTWREPCDYLACGFGLVPNVELAVLLGCSLRDGAVAVDEWQQTSVPNVYCAGEPTGIGGVGLALVEGKIAGYAAAGEPQKAYRLFSARRRGRRFQRMLHSAFALRKELKALPKPDTILCRCEDVPFGPVSQHDSWRSAKLQTRCGMGPCQGRVCGPAAEFLFGWRPDSVRPPIFPAELGHLAAPVSIPSGRLEGSE